MNTSLHMRRLQMIGIVCVALSAAWVTSAASDAKVDKGATVVFSGETYHFKIYPKCLITDDGYVIRGVTTHAAESDTVDEKSPSLNMYTDASATRIEFWVDNNAHEPSVRLLLEGESRIAIENDKLHYQAPAATGSEQTISIDVQC